MLSDNLDRIEDALKRVYTASRLGAAVRSGINAAPGFGEEAAAEIAKLTGLQLIAVQVGGGAGGYLEMKCYKPLIIFN